MPDTISFLKEYIEFFPLVAFFGLLLAGINLPVSEDLIIITGALVSHNEDTNLFLTLAAIYAGVIASDYFVYWVGTRVREGAAKSPFFVRVIPQPVLEKMRRYLDRYGIFTFIICRFIPFGVRNTLFFSAGFFKLKFRLFAVYEIIAAMISVNTLFFLVYRFGEDIKRPIKISGIILFAALSSALISLIIRLTIKWRRKINKQKSSLDTSNTSIDY